MSCKTTDWYINNHLQINSSKPARLHLWCITILHCHFHLTKPLSQMTIRKIIQHQYFIRKVNTKFKKQSWRLKNKQFQIRRKQLTVISLSIVLSCLSPSFNGLNVQKILHVELLQTSHLTATRTPLMNSQKACVCELCCPTLFLFSSHLFQQSFVSPRV